MKTTNCLFSVFFSIKLYIKLSDGKDELISCNPPSLPSSISLIFRVKFSVIFQIFQETSRDPSNLGPLDSGLQAPLPLMLRVFSSRVFRWVTILRGGCELFRRRATDRGSASYCLCMCILMYRPPPDACVWPWKDATVRPCCQGVCRPSLLVCALYIWETGTQRG